MKMLRRWIDRWQKYWDRMDYERFCRKFEICPIHKISTEKYGFCTSCQDEKCAVIERERLEGLRKYDIPEEIIKDEL